MKHGVVEVFAYQETLLIMAVFGIAVLAMIWVGFRRWLQHKEKMAQLIAGDAAERAARHDARMDRVEARLESLQQTLTNDGVEPAAQIDALRTDPLPTLHTEVGR